MDAQQFINENDWSINNNTSLTKWYVLDMNAKHTIRFDLFVAHIKANGIKMRFPNKTLPIVVIDEYFYWVEVAAGRFKNTIVNRALISDITTYTDVEQYDALFVDANYIEEEKVLAAMIKNLEGSVLDIGCGTGLLTELFNIEDYTGIDASPLMIQKFIDKQPHRKHQLTICKAEQFTETKRTYDNVIALFSASYIDHLETFKRLWNGNGTMFLMFYKNNYFPKTHQLLNIEAPYKLRTIQELEEYFNTEVIEFNGYNIVML